MNRIWVLVNTAIVGVSILCAAALGQSPEGMQDKLQGMPQATAKNEQTLHDYQWMESTTVALDGNTLPPRQSSCQYAADGTVLKTPLGSPDGAQGRGGPLRKHMIEEKKEKAQATVAEARAVTALYTPLDRARLKDALTSGKAEVAGDSITINGYAKPGDQLVLTVDPALKQITKVLVRSYFDKPDQAMTLQITFATLLDQTLHPALTTIEAPSKKLTISTSDSQYMLRTF